MPRRQGPPFGLRMPDDLKEWIKEKAKREGRSANNLIVHLLNSIRLKDETPANE